MTGGSSDDGERPTLPVKEAAALLGVTPQRVRQLLDEQAAPLSGPPSPGRGRGRQRLVWADTIEAESQRRRDRGNHERPRATDAWTTLDKLASELETLRAEVRKQSELLSQLTRVNPAADPEGEVARLRWALIQTNAANDLLHEAADRQDEAQEADRRAAHLRAQAYKLARRSDRIRSEIVGAVLMPDDLETGEPPL